MPLRAASIDSDWNFALSLLAHDREVTRTYEAFLHSPRRPALFIDLGTNFGFHSLMMAKLGVRTIAVEPNPLGRDYAASVFEANEVHPTWHRTALGLNGGTIVLRFPEGQTWLGTTVDDIATAFDGASPVRQVTTEVRALDDLLRDERPEGPVLIKVDVEGQRCQRSAAVATSSPVPGRPSSSRRTIVRRSWRYQRILTRSATLSTHSL